MDTYLPFLEELIASYNQLTMLEKDFHGLPVLCWADLSFNKIKYIGRELVTKTRCKVHGIPGILKIYLEDNPILCDDELPEIMSAMEVNHTRIHGNTNCEEIHELVVEENVPDLFNINALPPALINEITPKPIYPLAYLDNTANQIPLSVTESPVEVKVVPLHIDVSLDKTDEKSSNLIVEKPVDLEMVLK